MADTDIHAQIDRTVKENDVVLFMKGTKTMPQCGFSSRVSQILSYLKVDWHDVNVLSSDEMRQGIKDYTDWPTTPQLYVKGEFLGGCDIITEMTLSGELDQALEKAGVSFSKEAAEAIRSHNSQQA
ncbi:MAG: Grx4 family monothiol glutaredoxin [Pseudomonadota bacterium]